jgi:hypothetical protein
MRCEGFGLSPVHGDLIAARELIKKRKRDHRCKEQDHRSALILSIEDESAEEKKSENQCGESGGFVLDLFRKNGLRSIKPVLEIKRHPRDSSKADPNRHLN